MKRLPDLRTPRALVADDDDMVSGFFRECLEGMGYSVVTVANGFDAVCQLLGDDFDVALLDINMPRMHGLEVLREMRMSTKIIPVLIITAYPGLSDHKVVQDYPAVRFLTKPVRLAQLRMELDKAVHWRGEEEER